MTVAELIAQLQKCPQDAEVSLYYDGAPRLTPDFAFLAPAIKWSPNWRYIPGETRLVVIGQKDDIYNLDDDEEWGGKAQVLYDVATTAEDKDGQT